MIELIKKPNMDFMGKRFYAFAFSGIISLVGVLSLFQIWLGKANLGIDFAGGTSVQVRFQGGAPGLLDVRKSLEEAGLKDFDLQDLPTEGKVLITVKRQEATLGGFSDLIISTLSTRFEAKAPVVDSTTEIGPKVGERLRNDALLAIGAATLGILIYVAFRFQLRFGVGATVATFHDVLAVLAIFWLMGKEINLILISALLLVAGYSLTDTVVVFDRIRENMKSRMRTDVIGVINMSINEVLSRTIIVSMTTLFAAMALYLFGGEVIHDFALAIVMGIVVGTYSSVFIASPVVYYWGGAKGFSKK